MGKENSVIETGVDKLVDLIRAKEKISVAEAAKKLGVGPVVVEEWADFLEEEGIISIEYKFATPYLVQRKLDKDEIKVKEKELHGKKEGFIRKAEVTLALLDKEGENFVKFKDNFEKLKKELGSELKNVESQLKQLEKFEELRNGVDKQIMSHEKEFRNKIDAYEKEIKREEQKYMIMINELNRETEKLDKERLETLSLREKERNLRKKVEQFQENIVAVNAAIKKGESQMDDVENRIKKLKKLGEKVKKELLEKSSIGDDLVKEGEKHKEKVLELQKSILEKVEKNKEDISEQIEKGKISTKKFREFFNKKVEIESLIKKLDKERDDLEYELIQLVKKAKAFHLSSNSSGFKGHVKQLEDAYQKVNKKKEKFEKEVVKLGSLLKS